MENNKNYTLKDYIIGFVFIIWFFASIIALFKFSQSNIKYCVMIFGQYFLVFSIIILTNKKPIWHWFSFMYPGLACLIVPFLMLHPELFKNEVDWDNVIKFLGVIFFVMTGLILTITTILKLEKLKKNCTNEVLATVISHKEHYNKGTTTHCPIYEFIFNGTTYQVSNNEYSNVGVNPVGKITKIKINPHNPEEFLDNMPASKGTIILGLFFLINSMPALIYLIINL